MSRPCHKIPFRDRPAFTLIEMMVAITILLILTAITVAVVNVSMDQDRISDSGRTVQAFLEGARDRAIHAGQPRGVRFLLDPNDPSGKTVASMVYIGAPELYAEGAVRIDTSDRRTVRGVNTNWTNLIARQRLFANRPTRIRIPRENGLWYTVTLPDPLLEKLNLTRDYRYLGTPPTHPKPMSYLLELAPAVLPNQEPRQLAKGIVIDLKQAPLPSTWSAGTRDILFSPRGTVTGPLSGEGMIHLVLADVVDVENGRAVGDPAKEGGELIVTITTQTGKISTHHVDTTDADANGVADDPFRFAELGEAAK